MSIFNRFLVGSAVVILSGCGGGDSSKDNRSEDNQPEVKVNIVLDDINITNLDGYTLASSENEVNAGDSTLLALEKEEKDVVALMDNGGVPVLMGRKFSGDSDVAISLASSAEIFVLATPRFNGVQTTDPRELSKRIKAHTLFSDLIKKIKRAIQTENPCPLNPTCNYQAAEIAGIIANDLEIDDLYKGGN